MSIKGPIVIVENDRDDQELLKLALKNLNVRNKILVYEDGTQALSFLKSTSENPFLIISNIRMPRMDGLAFRAAINADGYLKKKSIPFVFLSELADPDDVNSAYHLNAQGFFIKPSSIELLQGKLDTIIKYWENSIEPNQLLY